MTGSGESDSESAFDRLGASVFWLGFVVFAAGVIGTIVAGGEPWLGAIFLGFGWILFAIGRAGGLIDGRRGR